MNRRQSLSVAAILVFSAFAGAMDGTCIALITGGPTYKSWSVFGRFVKYEIKGDAVVAVDSLPVLKGGAPSINRSGTYYAFTRTVKENTTTAGEYFTRVLVIKPLYGSPTAEKVIPLQPGAEWIWWANDGTIFYSQYLMVNNSPTGQHRIRKLTLTKEGGQLKVTDIAWAKMECAAQGGFINVDGTGTKLMWAGRYSAEGGGQCGDRNPAVVMTGDTTRFMDPSAVFTGGGCGFAISASGGHITQWVGGHNVTVWTLWGGQNYNPNYVSFSTLNSTWAVYGPNDPEGKLEINTDGTWKKNPVGVMGADNVWSKNSDNWHVCEIGMGFLDIDADCYNAIAISSKTSKAINITKIMPVKAMMSSRSQFRGITFPPAGTPQRSADRPSLWVSNQDDVHASLWQYVQNRQNDNQYWSDLLGLPLSTTPPTGVEVARHSSVSAGESLRKTASGYVVHLPVSGAFTVTIADAAGRVAKRIRGEGARLAIPALRPGVYSVTVMQKERVFSSTIAAM